MRKRFFRALALSAVAGLVIGGAGVAAANPNPPDGGEPTTKKASKAAAPDELPNPQAEKQRALQSEALQQVLTGKKKVQTINGIQVVKMGKKQARYTKAEQAQVRAGKSVKPRLVDSYVPLSREKTDKIFVLLTEFGTDRATDIDPRYGDQDTDPDTAGPATFEGPLHNAIPAPDRNKDNSTIWQADYSPEHYRQLYFGTGAGVQSLKTYYQRQSSGRYSVDGTVSDWVKVRYNEARYGRSDGFPCADNVCSNTWALLTDGLNQWVADQKAAGKSDAQIKTMVASFDQEDRNDFDGDGNFREPDGYIDHFQIVHSGGDQADGDPQQGEDAIWSHRWKAFQNSGQGPTGNLDGGVQIGNTGIWAADYTIQPENGGLSVFAHEYGHDLGLPDHYDAATDNPVNWWTLMAQSRARAANDVGIGTRPADLGVWDKLFLGWLDYEVAVAGQSKTYQLGPHEYNTDKAQALAVVLPKKSVTTTYPTPVGTKQWWSGAGNNLNSTLTRQLTLPTGAAQLTFKAAWNIEDCGTTPCDYAYVEVQDGAGAWTAIPGSITKAAEGNGIDGDSDGYQDATFDLSSYAGKTIGLRFRYATDGAAQGQNPAEPSGLFVDDISIKAGTTTVFTDGAENGLNGWTATGFSIVGGSVVNKYDQFYLASYRTYESYDRYLKTGPYNFGFGAALPDKVEFFPYQTGLLVNYWDTSYGDNITSEHPGNGLVLPIDAHPAPIYRLDGTPWRGRIQTYDAPFSLRKADSFTLHYDGKASYIRGQDPVPLFDDTRSYWNAALPYVGVKTPGVGVTLKVAKQADTTMTVKLGTSKSVSPAATLRSARSGS